MLRASWMADQDVVHVEDREPLLQDGLHEPHIPARPHNTVPVIGVLGLSLIFLFVLSTVFFGALYYKTLQNDAAKQAIWPGPSHSLLGEYTMGSVAADHEFCSEIGRDTLLKGGNAVEAAIAALFCIGVMDTQSSGLGGGHFMTIYNATTGQCHVVDARERAPLSASKDMYKDRWNKSQVGWEAVAVPGELHGLWTEFKEFGGNLEWKTLVEPTITLMKEGYPTSHALAASLERYKDDILNEPTMKMHFINPKTKQVYKKGEQIKTRANLLNTLEKIATSADPVHLFYEGELTQQMVDEFRKNGGIISQNDFASYKSIVRRPEEVITLKLSSGLVACGPPPPSSSAVTLAILGLTEGFHHDTSTLAGFTNYFHRFLESSKFAYAQRSDLGDMDYEKDALELAKNITTQDWLQQVRLSIDDVTHNDSYYGGHFQLAAPDHGTTHISVVDKHGNAVSVTSTINLILGAKVVSESSGILWNDQMDDFSLPGHPNYFHIPPSPANFIKPGKRPQSSMSPLVVFDSKRSNTVLSVGAAGGSTIISGVAGVGMHILQNDKNVKQAIDLPRLHNQLRPNYTQYEDTFPAQLISELRQRGHDLRPVKSLTVVTAVHKVNGTIYANSDFRKGTESEPAGY